MEREVDKGRKDKGRERSEKNNELIANNRKNNKFRLSEKKKSFNKIAIN
jgi:hypothetical protein